MMDDTGRFKAEIAELGARVLRERQRREIEQAIDRIKEQKSPADSWFRSQWYRAAAQRERKLWIRPPMQPVKEPVPDGGSRPRITPGIVMQY